MMGIFLKYLFLRGRERERERERVLACMSTGGTEKEGDRGSEVSSRLDSREPSVGLEHMKHEFMT